MRKTIEGTTYNTATVARLATAQWTEDDGTVRYGTPYQPRSGASSSWRWNAPSR
jgi:hypothetical protein